MRAAALLLALAVAGAALAADRTAPLPAGWKVAPFWVSASRDGSVALMLHPSAGSVAEHGSRAMIVPPSGEPVFVSFPGRIAYLLFSPDGSRLLVVEQGEPPRWSLVAAPKGEILWTKADPRSFEFSGTGKVLAAVKLPGETAAPDGAVEVFDLAGRSLRTFPGDAHPVGVIVPDDGTRVLEVTRGDGMLSCWEATPEPHVAWARSVAGAQERVYQLRRLSPDLVTIELGLGKFHLLTNEGVPIHTYEPKAVTPVGSKRNYMSYNAFATPKDNEVLLFDGTPDAMLLDMRTGALADKRLDLSVPEGFALVKNNVDQSRLVFHSPTAVLIRTIGY